jgi:branched-chain amino acid transport system permease protein
LGKYSRYLWALFVLGLFVLPQVYGNYYLIRILTTTGIYLIVVGGLNVMQGYTGLISIGHAGLYGVGAYAMAIMVKKVGMPYLPSVLTVMLIGALIGFCLGMVCLKLKHAYLAIVTLAFALIIQTIAVNWRELTGGMEGFLGITKPGLADFAITNATQGFYFILVLNIVVFFVIRNIVQSSMGRAMKAVRDDDIAANMMGINVVRTKLFAFTVSSVLAVLAGSCYAGLYGAIFPDYFDMNLSVLFLCMLVIGGAGTMIGPLVGTFLIAVSMEALGFLGMGQMLVYGILIVFLCVFKPGGFAEVIDNIVMSLKAKTSGRGEAENV